MQQNQPLNPRKQEIDAKVQAAVENLQAGRTVEDDAGIEFKAEWPDPAKKARQLAGAANSLRGSVLIYVIGVDDSSGAVTVPTKMEAQEWYAKARKVFDQVAPELLWVQTVYIGDGSESVQALVFDTSDFPYVVNAENRREVPMRVGTGTESAHRHQLVRMFEPSLRPPSISFTECEVGVYWADSPSLVQASEPPEVERNLNLSIRVHARVFIEHFGAQPTTLPIRDMRSRLVCQDFEHRFEVQVMHLGDSGFHAFISPGAAMPPDPVPPQFGVYARDQHVIATAPGEFTISTRSPLLDGKAPNPVMDDLHDLFASTDEARVDLAVRVVGVQSVIRLSAPLRRSEGAETQQTRKHPHGEAISQHLGTWELRNADSDPWGE